MAKTLTTGAARWPWAHRAIHWGTALCIVLTTALVLARDHVDDDDLTDQLLEAHRALGMFLLCLTLLRLVSRLRAQAPDHGQALWAKRLASAIHTLIYLLLLALPVLGWLTSNAHGVSLQWGPLHVPDLLARDHDLGDQLGEAHEALAYGLLAIAGLHVVAALWHHRFKKDQVPKSML